MNVSIIEKLSPSRELSLEMFDALTDEELIYLGGMHGITGEMTRQDISQQLLAILTKIKQSQDEIREGEKFDFNVDGVDFSINLEYLGKHIIAENNDNIPYTNTIFPQSLVVDLSKKYTSHMISLKRKGSHILTMSMGMYAHLIFPNYKEMIAFLKKGASEMFNYLEDEEFTELTDFIEKNPRQLFHSTVKAIPKSLSVVSGNKYFDKDHNIYNYLTLDYTGTPLIINGVLRTNRQAINDELLRKLDQFARTSSIELFLDGDIENYYRDDRQLLEFMCLFKRIFPEKVERALSIVSGMGEKLFLHSFAYEEGLDEDNQLYRVVLLINECFINYEKKGIELDDFPDERILVIQPIDRYIPNNPSTIDTYYPDIPIESNLLDIIQRFRYEEYIFNRSAIDEGYSSGPRRSSTPRSSSGGRIELADG